MKNILPFAILCVAWIVAIVAGPYFATRKHFKGSPNKQGPVTTNISAEGIRFTTDISDSAATWKSFTKWMEGRKVVALFTGPAMYVVIPKRAFTEAQMDEFREILKKNVSTPK